MRHTELAALVRCDEAAIWVHTENETSWFVKDTGPIGLAGPITEKPAQPASQASSR